jgi:hypothetical protein
VIHAQERSQPQGRDGIDWKLLTDLPVRSRREAIEKLEWYAQRWKIEMFHQVLQSGCKAEESRLRAAERLVNLVAVLCILSWRIFWMTMINRSEPDATRPHKITGQLLDQARPTRRLSGPCSRPASWQQSHLEGAYSADRHRTEERSSVLNLWVIERLNDP